MTDTIGTDTGTVGLLGDGGLLHRRIGTVVARRGHLVQLAPADLDPQVTGCAVLVVATDRWNTTDYPAIRRSCAAAGIPWLPVCAEPGHVVVGPVTAGALPGCGTCAHTRRRRARERPQEFADLWRRHGDRLSRLPSARRTRLAADVVAELVAAELDAIAADPSGATSGLRHAIRLVELRHLGLSRHRFLPDPACPDCGDRPDDDREAARITLRSQPKLAPDVFRVRDLAPRDAELRDRYVDPEVGLIRTVASSRTGGAGAFVLGAAAMSARGGPAHGHNHDDRYGWGRTLDVPSAERTAILEALERLAGEGPGGRRTVVRGSYRELSADALDPKTLGLHTDDQYASHGFGFRRYSDDLVCQWVWGYSFGRSQPVLVPQRCAYYGIHSHDDPPFVYEISNGCAIGGCLEEAIFHGLCEVAERDAFLMTWYARMPVPKIDPRSARDRTIPLLTAHLRQLTGHEIELYDTTVEQGVPSFWVMAVDRSGDPSRPKALCAAGSAIQPERGVVNALHELASLVDQHHRGYGGAERERAAAMVADPSLVDKMADHSLLYCHHDAFRRLDFLDSGPPRTFADLAPRWRWPVHADLRADLGELVGRYLAGGLDVVVVDQTMPEHRASGLSAVKVLVPGTLPMTFGHRNRRTAGLPRLLRVPYDLGYRDRPLTVADINTHPHPFP